MDYSRPGGRSSQRASDFVRRRVWRCRAGNIDLHASARASELCYQLLHSWLTDTFQGQLAMHSICGRLKLLMICQATSRSSWHCRREGLSEGRLQLDVSAHCHLMNAADFYHATVAGFEAAHASQLQRQSEGVGAEAEGSQSTLSSLISPVFSMQGVRQAFSSACTNQLPCCQAASCASQ